ncbi:MAG: hypothetical protein RL685_557 [Pseudomonadota bacterium]|jgi:hypothetical protein
MTSLVSLLSRRGSSLTAAALLAAFAGVGCSASADIPEVKVTQSDVTFDGVPRVPGLTDVTTTLQTQFDHPKGLGLPDMLDPELYPLAAQVQALGSMENLAFIQEIKLTLASRAAGAPPPAVVANYRRTGSTAAGKLIQLQTDGDADVLAYWETKDAFYDLEVSGILPENNWAVDVVFSFSGSLSISSN